jgi:hypothetical protein
VGYDERSPNWPSTVPREIDILFPPTEVDRALVALLDFKSSVPSEQGGRWVRFPCTSAIMFISVANLKKKALGMKEGDELLVTLEAG